MAFGLHKRGRKPGYTGVSNNLMDKCGVAVRKIVPPSFTFGLYVVDTEGRYQIVGNGDRLHLAALLRDAAATLEAGDSKVESKS